MQMRWFLAHWAVSQTKKSLMLNSVLKVQLPTCLLNGFVFFVEMALCWGGHWEVAHAEVQGVSEGGNQEEDKKSSLSKLRQSGERLPLRRQTLQNGQGGAAGTQTVQPERQSTWVYISTWTTKTSSSGLVIFVAIANKTLYWSNFSFYIRPKTIRILS